ncbi:TetR/AcrR family transcriptional regulator [Kerstersia gyiorum]|jgi:AcrR family transcriptional regulator|uniref:TetR/AcrR family transcriptional regulator n=1 Tax=Kerstersia gyiorum TaxID=206506 RepID=UPI00243037BD|nr:TetR/AcrR family transcriptional regulator [Kerstersia gyiorum]MCH4272067.1 TetR/AcrR family transcriptional regulator [Kerstersia gyiorum]MCI1228480.1 TetR/AcrR family transcriptional regulator [Kerstersia gyiorum]
MADSSSQPEDTQAASTVRESPGTPKTARGARTRAQILRAAEATIGTLGYHRAGISDITRAAGVAQGTLYCYFSGKEEILRELVRDMGREVRAHLAAETLHAKDRLEAEEKGLHAFLKYLMEHPSLYRVLQEAQSVDESIYREYYESFGRGYVRLLSDATRKGEIRPGNDEIRVWALMGMAHFLGLRYSIWKQDMPFEAIVETMSGMFRHGLALDRKEKP